MKFSRHVFIFVKKRASKGAEEQKNHDHLYAMNLQSDGERKSQLGIDFQ
jgi:hypothetical protein